MAKNRFVHVELHTPDVAKAKEFYAAMFDWKMQDMEMGAGESYTVLSSGKDTIGGIMKKPMEQAPTQWLSYVSVEDLGASTARAKALGGQVYVENQPVPGMGTFSIISDPTGGPIALWQATPRRPAKAAARKPATKKRAAKKTAKRR